MPKNVHIVVALVAILTLMGGVFVWVYSELGQIRALEAQETGRMEWLDRFMEEMDKAEQIQNRRADGLERRIERLEKRAMSDGQRDS